MNRQSGNCKLINLTPLFFFFFFMIIVVIFVTYSHYEPQECNGKLLQIWNYYFVIFKILLRWQYFFFRFVLEMKFQRKLFSSFFLNNAIQIYNTDCSVVNNKHLKWIAKCMNSQKKKQFSKINQNYSVAWSDRIIYLFKGAYQVLLQIKADVVFLFRRSRVT